MRIGSQILIEAEMTHDLPSAHWSGRTAGSIIQSRVWRAWESGALTCKGKKDECLRSRRDRANSLLLYLFVLFRPQRDWGIALHISEGDFLYLVYWFRWWSPPETPSDTRKWHFTSYLKYFGLSSWHMKWTISSCILPCILLLSPLLTMLVLYLSYLCYLTTPCSFFFPVWEKKQCARKHTSLDGLQGCLLLAVRSLLKNKGLFTKTFLTLYLKKLPDLDIQYPISLFYFLYNTFHYLMVCLFLFVLLCVFGFYIILFVENDKK